MFVYTAEGFSEIAIVYYQKKMCIGSILSLWLGKIGVHVLNADHVGRQQ